MDSERIYVLKGPNGSVPLDRKDLMTLTLAIEHVVYDCWADDLSGRDKTRLDDIRINFERILSGRFTR